MIASSLTTVEISRKALIDNLQQFRRKLGPGVKMMAVVKANAYGHGIEAVSKIVSHHGADWLGVSSLEEGILLRERGMTLPILVLGYIPLAEIKEGLKNDLSFVVYHQEMVKKAAEEAKKLKKLARIHLKVETGTNRQGIRLKDLSPFVQFCLKQKNIFLEGIYTHYANVEEALDSGFALEQLKVFKRALQLIKEADVKIPIRHIACSAAAILFDQAFFDLVRIGIGLYGLWPSSKVKTSAQERKTGIKLLPVLTWKTKVAQVKEVPKGETIGYGRTYRTERKSRIAVLPVGYWDGYDRKLSNSGRVLIHGQFAPVVGRVCMNMTMVDVTDIPKVKTEDEVVLLGRQNGNEIPAEEIAQKIGTINYEVVTRINPELPRRII